MTPSTDVLILKTLQSDIPKFKRIFSMHDLETQGAQALWKMVTKGQSLDAIDIVIKSPSQREEADLCLHQMENVKLDLKTIQLLLKHLPMRRIIKAADLEGEDLDLNKFQREVRLLHEAHVGEKTAPVRGEWKDLVTLAFADKGKTFSTGLARLDRALEGGLWQGEIGFLLAPTYRGKTWMLCHLGSTAAMNGITCLHLTPELVDHRVLVRYAQNTLVKSRSDVLSYTPAGLKKALDKKWSAPLRIESCRGAGRSLAAILDQIYQLPPHSLILLDATELITLDSGSESWQAAGSMMVDLRDTAEEMECAIWVTSQTNRSGMYANRDAGMESIAESIKKAWVADVLLVLNQGSGDAALGRFRIQIEKAREREVGRDEIVIKGKPEYQKFLDLEEF